MPEILNSIIDALSSLPKELVVVIVSSLPIAEIRLGLPVGLFVMEFPLGKAFYLAVIGNMIPIIPILFLLEPISKYLVRFRLWRKFFDWFFARTKKKAEIIQRWEALGLMLFVSIPLPVTGVWTGCAAASLFKLKFRYAFIAAVLGAINAGIIVSILCLTGKCILKI